jgi:hypothetical protein
MCSGHTHSIFQLLILRFSVVIYHPSSSSRFRLGNTSTASTTSSASDQLLRQLSERPATHTHHVAGLRYRVCVHRSLLYNSITLHYSPTTGLSYCRATCLKLATSQVMAKSPSPGLNELPHHHRRPSPRRRRGHRRIVCMLRVICHVFFPTLIISHIEFERVRHAASEVRSHQ